MTEAAAWPTLGEFYAGKHIFITGGTGFVGKVLLERLLYLYPDIGQLYLLMRPKKSKSPQERLSTIFESPLYDKLRHEHLDFTIFYGEKLTIIDGDLEQDGLAISSHHLQLLYENIDLIFHSAATVRFDEVLQKAVALNVTAVESMIAIAKSCRRLQAFIQVSTAYANCEREHIEEKLYDLPYEPHYIVEMMKWMNEESIQKVTPILLGQKPNTYTFTKHLAEILVAKQLSQQVPTAVFRPSIIGCVWKEPLVGWQDNFNGPAGLVLGYASGFLRRMLCDQDKVADIIPVDITVNMLISIGWYTALMKNPDAVFYNNTCHLDSRMSWGAMGPHLQECLKTLALERAFRAPYCTVVPTKGQYVLQSFFVHTIPGYIADMVFKLMGKPAKFRRLYKMCDSMVGSLNFFTCREWDFHHGNFDKVDAAMTETDRKALYTDMGQFDWNYYMHIFAKGGKKYLLKEKDENNAAALRHVKRLWWAEQIITFAAYLAIWRFIISRTLTGKRINSWLLFVLRAAIQRFHSFYTKSSSLVRTAIST